MLFIKKSQSTIWIPKHCDADGPYSMTLTNNTTHAECTFNDLINEGYKSGYWIFMNLDFKELEGGEHTYKVFDNENKQIEIGLLQVMYELSEPINISYKKNTEKIIYNK